MLVYVDDIVITGNDEDYVISLIKQLSSEFALKELGELHYFLGIEVHKFSGGITLSQSKYAHDLLTRAKMLDCSHNNTPMPIKQQPTPTDLKKVDAKTYRSLVGALQYLTHTRPDIVYAVNKVCQKLNDPTEDDMKLVKRILRYIKGTINYGLKFIPQKSLKLCGFCDADWVGCIDTRRSTTRYCIFLGANCISWSSKRQPTV